MPKRSRSPLLGSIISVKYAHTSSAKCPKQLPVPNFDTISSDETVLAIFTFLDPYDLCSAQLVNKHWSRLATDNHLWRIMFLREFSQSRLRGSRGFTATNREIKPLPSRAHSRTEKWRLDHDLPENYTNWRWMFRISSNWSRGRCTATVQRASAHPGDLHSYLPSSYTPLDGTMDSDRCLDSSRAAHILLVGDMAIYASGQTSPAPTVYIFRDCINSGLQIRHDPSPGSLVSVTTVCLDHSSGGTRLAIFYSDHSWTICTVDYERRHVAIDYSSTSRSGAAIINAAFHHPILVTLSSSFRMCIYYLQTPLAAPILKHTLSSYSGFTPLTMTLARYRTPDQYRILLAHASPIYPAHWSPSVTDITISTQPSSDSSPSDTLSPLLHGSPHVRILSSSSTTNQLPTGWIPDGTPDGIPEELRLRWLRKVSHVSGIQTDGKFVVFASEDGGIQACLLRFQSEYGWYSDSPDLGLQTSTQCALNL
ncbi:unnamed protein product [Rhizoctonia solani]|uniref:F-box domain-containing protein n=1 Tax=Rhizoctonia solani TaxID=456999 RepID=A0A8H3DWY4_9AGAM|nr:unnamed protein product [Rhizoctonia solani]